MLSWLSFWLGLDATPGRITLCVTSLLALITQFSSIRRDLPPLSYIHRVDIWMVTCMCFVFASLLEFTLLIYMERQQRRTTLKSSDVVAMEANSSNITKLHDMKNVKDKTVLQNCPCKTLPVRKGTLWSSADPSFVSYGHLQRIRDWAQAIDKASRFLFPLAFLLFNAFYWPILLSR
ncbi:glycine receptor subunit beta-type 4-like [Stegodyphus dumicola]|uniref:glycine receptor subunit beta-type 4-like n=1 Tax=Stegodyphus dumicola TaxID=202533 RepID=UPI0015AAEE00|nr:glycine receptor subunit beta-type 4-like [Stegodyphus dumicola]